MHCLLFRHGIAEEPHTWPGDEYSRPLTKEGISKTKQAVDGFLEGEVFGSDLIQVGKEGTIEATVRAKHIVAQGPLRGDIAAQEKVELLAPAKVEGSIDSPVFLLEAGVLVNGTLKMASMNPALK